MNKYIVQKLATQYQIPNKQVEEIINGFYRGLRHYLLNAEESKGGIKIPGYLVFFIDLHREMKHIEKSLNNEMEPKRLEVFHNLETYRHKKVKLSKRDNERQNKIKDYYAQCNEK